MNLFKTSVLTGIATFARLLSGLVVMKLVAEFSGPEGVAQFGQFMSLAAFLVVFAGGGIGPGITKYLSQYNGDNSKIKSLLKNALGFTLIASISMCFLVLVLSEAISIWLFASSDFTWLIVVLAFTQIFVALHNFVIAIVNGMMDIRRLTLIHLCGAILGVIFPAVLGYFQGLTGVLLAFLLSQAALLFVSVIAYARSSYFCPQNIGLAMERQALLCLAQFSMMTLTSALMAPVVQIVVRNRLAASFSWEEVGYWQAVSKVSDAYLLFITMAISVYYLPKLSSLSEKKELKAEIFRGYMVIMPLASFGAVIIYVFRDLITRLLFSEKFLSGLYLYAPQLVGDVIKVAAFLLSYLMLAKALTRTFIFSEIIFSLSYVLLVFLLVDHFGLIGAMYAFAINYVLYLLFCWAVATLYLSRGKSSESL